MTYQVLAKQVNSDPATDREGVGDPIGEGDADEVVALLVANLPPNCRPAVDGTEDDLTE